MSAQLPNSAAVKADTSTHSLSPVDSCQKSPTNVTVEDVEAQVVVNQEQAHEQPVAPIQKLCSGVKQFWSSISIFTHRCEDRWILEILGCCLAVTCLVAIIAILATNQGSSLSSQGTLSINAWVSIFTAVMKAAVMLVIAEGMSDP
jgi:hypothetical protein